MVMQIISSMGHEAWMWRSNNVPGEYPAEQIAEQIELCDMVVYLCTGPDQPNRPNGQPYERNLAWNMGKRCAVLTSREEIIPKMLKAYTYRVVSEESFQAQCAEFIRLLIDSPSFVGEAQSLSEEDALDNER